MESHKVDALYEYVNNNSQIHIKLIQTCANTYFYNDKLTKLLHCILPLQSLLISSYKVTKSGPNKLCIDSKK